VVLPAVSVAFTERLFTPETSGTTQLNELPVKLAGALLQLTELAATPESESVTVPVTVTLDPLTVAPLTGELTVTTGGVLSTFKVTVANAVLPARSTAVPVMTCPEPSVVTTIGAVQLATPDVASSHVKLTVTLVLFQEAALAAGDAVAVMVG